MSASKTVTISAPVLRDFLTRIFKAAGCDDETARLCSEGAVDADLHGHHIQGTDHIYSTVRELRAGRLNGRPKVKITHETAATARIDGDGGPGHATGIFATAFTAGIPVRLHRSVESRPGRRRLRAQEPDRRRPHETGNQLVLSHAD